MEKATPQSIKKIVTTTSIHYETPQAKRQLFSPEKTSISETPARNLVSSKPEKISVYLRLKPLLEKEQRSIEKVDDNAVQVLLQRQSLLKMNDKGDRYYFDYVFDETTDQNTIFNKSAFPLVKSFFEGQSCLLFAYGVTNAGKTFTILGDPKNPGIIPKTLSYSFNLLNKLEQGHILKVTYVEVYNDNVYDLLTEENKKEKLQLIDQNGLIIVKGANQIEIKNIKDAGDVLTQGSKNRSHASTSLNRDSSRSHSVFTIKLYKKDLLISQLAIVDLAGSERAQRTNAQGDRLKEAISINQSLTTLGRCLNILRQNQTSKNQQIVPFRDSKLTRMFQDLITDGKVVMIVNISPSEMDVEENTFILKYAAVASKISTGTKVKKVISNETSSVSNVTNNGLINNNFISEQRIRDEMILEYDKIFKNIEHSFNKFIIESNQLKLKKRKLSFIEDLIEENKRLKNEIENLKNENNSTTTFDKIKQIFSPKKEVGTLTKSNSMIEEDKKQTTIVKSRKLRKRTK